MQKYKVSVIFTAFNTIELVGRAIESIPIRDDVQIICIDDHSTDGTEWILKNIRNARNNFVLKRNRTNKGHAMSKNIAYDLAEGEYIVQLDSDDAFVPEVFNDIVDHDLNADLVYFDMKVNNGSIWRSSPATTFTIMDHCSFIRQSLIGKHRCPDVTHGSGVYLNNDIQEELKRRNGSVKYTNKVMYLYNFPRENSILDRFHKGLL